MLRSLFALIVCIAVITVPRQAAASNYQVGTIVSVVKHQSDSSKADAGSYDVSIRVRDKIYTVFYTPENSLNSVEFAAGSDVLVSVGKSTLRFPKKFQEGNTEARILRTETLPPQSTIDWSKAPGQYFSMKMQNLTETLNLTDEQRTKIKPIVEQERAEVGAVCFTPTIPRKERLVRFEKVVRAGDEKMKPILSTDQWAQLQQLRKEQRQELRMLIAQ